MNFLRGSKTALQPLSINLYSRTKQKDIFILFQHPGHILGPPKFLPLPMYRLPTLLPRQRPHSPPLWSAATPPSRALHLSRASPISVSAPPTWACKCILGARSKAVPGNASWTDILTEYNPGCSGGSLAPLSTAYDSAGSSPLTRGRSTCSDDECITTAPCCSKMRCQCSVSALLRLNALRGRREPRKAA
jgi:hypothetical protein